MRRDDDFRMTPERMRRRQRLDSEHIERGAGELTAFQRSEQVLLDQMFAAADLNQIAAAAHATEQVAVENALRLARQRQQVHQHFGFAKHGVKSLATMEAPDRG